MMGTSTQSGTGVVNVSGPPAGVTVTSHDGITVAVTGSAPVHDSMLEEMFWSAIEGIESQREKLGKGAV